MQGAQVQSLGQEGPMRRNDNPLSILAWRSSQDKGLHGGPQIWIWLIRHNFRQPVCLKATQPNSSGAFLSILGGRAWVMRQSFFQSLLKHDWAELHHRVGGGFVQFLQCHSMCLTPLPSFGTEPLSTAPTRFHSTLSIGLVIHQPSVTVVPFSLTQSSHQVFPIGHLAVVKYWVFGNMFLKNPEWSVLGMLRLVWSLQSRTLKSSPFAVHKHQILPGSTTQSTLHINPRPRKRTGTYSDVVVES